MHAEIMNCHLTFVGIGEKIVRLSDDIIGEDDFYQFDVADNLFKAQARLWTKWIGWPVRCIVVDDELKDMSLDEALVKRESRITRKEVTTKKGNIFKGQLIYIDTEEKTINLSNDSIKPAWYNFDTSATVMKRHGRTWLDWIGLPVSCITVNDKFQEMLLIEKPKRKKASF